MSGLVLGDWKSIYGPKRGVLFCIPGAPPCHSTRYVCTFFALNTKKPEREHYHISGKVTFL